MKNYSYLKYIGVLVAIATLVTASPALAAKKKTIVHKPVVTVTQTKKTSLIVATTSSVTATTSNATSTNPVTSTTTPALATSSVSVASVVAPPPSDSGSPLGNVYLLTNHLTPGQTQDALALAVAFGVAGFLLAQQDMLWSLFALRSRRRTPVSLQSSGSQM
jgi:hypothetical protein